MSLSCCLNCNRFENESSTDISHYQTAVHDSSMHADERPIHKSPWASAAALIHADRSGYKQPGIRGHIISHKLTYYALGSSSAQPCWSVCFLRNGMEILATAHNRVNVLGPR